MALDKLVDSTQLDSDLTDVADEIRTAGGTLLPLSFPDDYVVAIGDIGNTEIKTASGSIAHFEDALARKAQDLTVAIEPVQSGSGDPSPDNVRPISGWTGANVTRTGVNVWDEEWEFGRYDVINGGVLDDSTRIRCKNPIPVTGGTSYYITKPATYLCYDADGNYTDQYNYLPDGGSFTVGVNARYIRFYATSAYGTTYNHDISINYPSTDHDYHSGANKTTYSITFPTEAGTVYGGSLDVTTGKLTVDRAMVDLGTLTWTRMSTNASGIYRFGSVLSGGTVQDSGTDIPNMLCSVYEAATPNATYRRQKTGITNNIGSVPKVIVYDPAFELATAKDFKTAMSGVQLAYELATPIVYNLTPTEVTTLLGTNNVWADTGDSTIKYIAPKAQIPSAQGVYF